VDIKIKATLTKCIAGKLYICKSARLKKCKFEKVQNEKKQVYKLKLRDGMALLGHRISQLLSV
jgi:hypothetical protein